MAYIAVADVTNVHFKQFPTAIKEAYVDEANEYLVDFAMTLGLEVSDILEPVTIQTQRMLATYVCMRFAEDSIGTNANSLAQGEDMYVEMRKQYRELLRDYQSKITPEMLTQTVSDRSQRSVSCGRIFRS